MTDPNAFLDPLAERLIILDEVQRVPDLFSQLRGIIDRRRTPGRFLLLGSASPLLLRQSSESLAGRIAHVELPNLKKRLVKSPKIYLRDSGLLHALLGLETEGGLRGHPVFGASWEGFALEQVLQAYPGWKASHYRTATGVELDLVLEKGSRRLAFEFKASSAPTVTRGIHQALADIRPEQTFIVAPVDQSYPIAETITVCSLGDLSPP